MSATITSLPLPVVSPEVRKFAEEQGVSAYLPAMLATTRRIFPTWPIKIFLEDDPEIANTWHILFEIQVPDEATAETLFALHQQWGRESADDCPSTHICTFCLGMA